MFINYAALGQEDCRPMAPQLQLIISLGNQIQGHSLNNLVAGIVAKLGHVPGVHK